MMKPKEVFAKLKSVNVRIFVMRLGGHSREERYFIHPDKTTEQWRKDVAEFRNNSVRGQTYAQAGETLEDTWADNRVWNDLNDYLHKLGYVDIGDVAADVYEGRIASLTAKLVDDPDHDDIQADGFGHYGWESKPCKMKESPSESADPKTT